MYSHVPLLRTFYITDFSLYSKLHVIRIQWDLKLLRITRRKMRWFWSIWLENLFGFWRDNSDHATSVYAKFTMMDFFPIPNTFLKLFSKSTLCASPLKYIPSRLWSFYRRLLNSLVYFFIFPTHTMMFLNVQNHPNSNVCFYV